MYWHLSTLLETAKTEEEVAEKVASLMNAYSAPENLFVIIDEKHKVEIKIKAIGVMLKS